PQSVDVVYEELCVDKVVFFFQAEDGIRDRNVTGVQTCALPIFCFVISGSCKSSSICFWNSASFIKLFINFLCSSVIDLAKFSTNVGSLNSSDHISCPFSEIRTSSIAFLTTSESIIISFFISSSVMSSFHAFFLSFFYIILTSIFFFFLFLFFFIFIL